MRKLKFYTLLTLIMTCVLAAFAYGDDAVMVKDIYPGITSSSPNYLTEVNGELYFVANDGKNGAELWKSDGTAAGTVMLKDIIIRGG